MELGDILHEVCEALVSMVSALCFLMTFMVQRGSDDLLIIYSVRNREINRSGMS